MRTDIIYNQHCLTGMRQRLPDECIDLLCCDPQYGWNFMGRDWDRAVPSVDIWRQCFRVLKPGAFAFIMSGPRLDCLVENGMRIREAGFVISFSPIFWAFSSGFPKAMSISKAADKREGRPPQEYKAFASYIKERRTELGLSMKDIAKYFLSKTGGLTGCVWNWENGANVPTKKQMIILRKVLKLDNRFDELIERAEAERQIIFSKGSGIKRKNLSFSNGLPIKEELSLPATSVAQALDGSFAGFQPKPSVEIVIVAMKPLSEKTYVDQALKNRKGITWLDEGRIPTKDVLSIGSNKRENGVINFGMKDNKEVQGQNPQGRFPANLLCSNDVLNDGKITKSGKDAVRRQEGMFLDHHLGGVGNPQVFHPDSGSFSRYFSLDAWFEKKLRELPEGVRRTFPFLITPKASKTEKNRGCEQLYWEKDSSNFGYHQVDKKRWEWLGREEERVYKQTGKRVSLRARGNIHPTVKPLKLGFYLATIGSREGDIILDPFGGSGWMAIVAKSLGRHYVVFETEKENVRIANSRMSEIQLELMR